MAVDFENSQTKKNLEAAFAGESQASRKYSYYASKAKKEYDTLRVQCEEERVSRQGELDRHDQNLEALSKTVYPALLERYQQPGEL